MSGLATFQVGIYRVQWALLLMGLFGSAAAMAAQECTYYVSSSQGDDGHAGSRGHPFRSIQRAADAALKPGDTVCVLAGRYRESRKTRPFQHIKGVKVRASGTADQPIVFRAIEKPVVIDQEFDYSFTGGGNARLVVGFYVFGHDHIIIDGFEITNVNAGVLTQAVVRPKADFQGVFDPPAHLLITNNFIHSVRRDARRPGFDTNVGALQLNQCFDCLAERNYLSDIGLVDKNGDENLNNQNSAGIHSFGMLRTVLRENLIEGAHTGIFFKSWSNQPLTGDANYHPDKIPMPFNVENETGLSIIGNTIMTSELGIRLSPSGGMGRAMAKNGRVNGNPAHRNIVITHNVFLPAPDGGKEGRQQWALKTDLRGASAQSRDLQFSNNTVITQNGIDIDAVRGVRAFNNIFSLLPGGTGIRSRYVTRTAGQAIAQGDTLNLGTPQRPRPSRSCQQSPDPALSSPPFVSTPPFIGAVDDQFYCSDNTLWHAEFDLVDFNFYHLPTYFELNAFSPKSGSIGRKIYWRSGFNDWTYLTAETFGLAFDFPDRHSIEAILPYPEIIKGVSLGPQGEVDIDWNHPELFAPHHKDLINQGRRQGLPEDNKVTIGAHHAGVLRYVKPVSIPH